MRTLVSALLLTVALPGAAQASNYFTTASVLTSGDVALSNVGVGGGVMAGGNANIYGGSRIGTNLGSSANGTTTVAVAGNMTYVGSSLSHGNVVYGGTNNSDPYNVVQPQNGGTVARGSVDVASSFSQLSAISTYLAALPTTGTLTSQWGAGTLSGTSTGLNVYTVTTADLASLYALTITGGTSAIINVTGSDFSKYLSYNISGLSADNILFNFVDATSVTVSGAAMPGTILAPDAIVTMNGGTVQGSVTAKTLVAGGATIAGSSYSGSLAGYTPGQTPAVPEPASWAMMIAGFGIVGAALRRRRAPRAFAQG